ncbi:hypothetical protein Srufu_058700 [Streptomyces libani subsp. rufus]|nr:hypothetical protein Srufu_058700 [Streptomyces libani subsp. rufus]
MAVALVVRRERAGGAPVVVERADDALDPAAVPLHDLLRCPALHRPAERIADGGADQRAGRPVLQGRGTGATGGTGFTGDGLATTVTGVTGRIRVACGSAVGAAAGVCSLAYVMCG